MKTVAIIAAGGSGRRMGVGKPKQYLLLGGIPILVHTLKIFQESQAVDAIFLIVPAGDTEDARREFVLSYGLSKVNRILAGGPKRQDSVRNGLSALTADCGLVVIHDGVRPFISGALIAAVVEGAKRDGAVAVGVPVKDTVKQVDPAGSVMKTLDRDSLWLTQTPQAFRRDIIEEAYDKARHNGFYGHDDAILVEQIGVRVRMIPGSYDNIKITTQEDLAIAEVLLKRCRRGGD
jgi:2-C-methyl-D-erythritol 4-phosphate cytidylyltransferase